MEASDLRLFTLDLSSLKTLSSVVGYLQTKFPTRLPTSDHLLYLLSHILPQFLTSTDLDTLTTLISGTYSNHLPIPDLFSALYAYLSEHNHSEHPEGQLVITKLS